MRNRPRAMPIRVLSLWAFVLSAALPCALRGAETDDNVIETFDVARNGDFLLIPVQIAGKTYDFLVDTGADLSALDDSFRAELTAAARRSITLNGTGDYAFYEMPAGFVGKSKFPLPPEAICLDLSALRDLSGFDIRGILGMDFLKHHVLRIDFDDGRLSVLRSGENSPGAKLKLDYDRNCATVNVRFSPNTSAELLIDTGLRGTYAGTLKSNTFNDLAEIGFLRLAAKPARTINVNGEHYRRKARLASLQLGDFRHGQLGFYEGPLNALGLNYLSRYTVTLDFPNGMVYLNPGKRFSEPMQFDMSGILIVSKAGDLLVKEIANGSPAAALGLHAGDRLFEIDGQSCADFSVFELNRLLSEDGRRVRISVQRENKEFDIVVLLADWEKSKPSAPETKLRKR